MKTALYYYLIIPLIAVMTSCEKDNYDMPNQSLTGRVVYNNEPINVEYNQVRIQLWESGWQLHTPIDVYIKPDGTFSAVLFKGSYKMVIPSGQGPFMSIPNETTQSDTVLLDLNGNTEMDIQVMPYYMVRNTQLVKNGNSVDASFGLEKVINDANAKDVERVYLYLNKTQFVSGPNNIKAVEIAGADIADMSSIHLTAEIPEMVPTQNYIYARVGVRISGVEDLLFSPVQKITF